MRFILFIVLATLGVARAQPLSLTDALTAAESRSPQLAAQRAAAESAAALAPSARELPDAKLIIGVENVPVEGADRWSLTADGMTMRRIGVMQDMVLGEKRELRGTRADAEARREAAMVEVQRADLRREVATAWLERYYAERAKALVEGLAREAQLQVSVATAEVSAAKASVAEAIAARSLRATLLDRTQEADLKARRAAAMLVRWLGDDAARPLGAPPDVRSLGVHHGGQLEMNLESHPHLAMYAPMETAAEAEMKLAAAATKPDWSVELTYGARGAAYSNMVSLMFRMDLPIFESRRQGPAAAAKAKLLEQVRAQADDAKRRHIAEIRTSVIDWEISRERLERHERELVPLAEERARAAASGYEGGRVDLAAALEARRGVIEAKLAALNAELEMARAWAQLAFLVPERKAAMNRAIAVVAAASLIGAGALGGYWFGHKSPSTVHLPPSPTSQDRKVLYWHDPMYPGQKFDKPGKSPFMDMQLVPVYAEDDAPTAGVKVSPQLAQNLGVRTTVAERGRLAASMEAVGSVAFDERAVHLVQARTAGYVEQLFVRAPLDPVRKGQPLVRLFVPEWAGAQQEYLALKTSNVEGAAELARAARNRLLLLSMTEEQVQQVDREGKPVTRVTIASPADGIVGELGAREGMNVMPGAALFRINGLATVWVNVDVPEQNAAAIRPGTPITATVQAYPGERFSGKVSAVLPEVVAATRTVRARVELANPGGKLKPGMYATVAIAPPQSREAVLVPSEAVIVTGKRSVVVVDRGEGRFEPVDVEIGREEGGKTEVLKGIEAGTKVVASGQFLIDSESSLRSTERRMTSGAAPEAAAAPSKVHKAEGKLERIGHHDLTISHGPVPSLQWGSMTMDFNAPKDGLPKGLKAGDPITFEFVQGPGGSFDVTKIERKGAAP